MSLVHRPHREDYFPKLKRGHGSAHDKYVPKTMDINPAWDAVKCVDPTCQLNAPKSKNQHIDTKANIQEWCDQRGLRMAHSTPYGAMVKATGGR